MESCIWTFTIIIIPANHDHSKEDKQTLFWNGKLNSKLMRRLVIDRYIPIMDKNVIHKPKTAGISKNLLQINQVTGYFPRNLARGKGGIFNNRLLFKNNMLLFSLLFSGNFVGDKAVMEGDKVVTGESPQSPH